MQCRLWLWPFSHALVAALQVITLGMRPVVALALLACTDGRAAGDNIGHEASELQETDAVPVVALALHACTDGHAAGDNLGHEASELQEP